MLFYEQKRSQILMEIMGTLFSSTRVTIITKITLHFPYTRL